MACRYLPEILAKDPTGPYLLAGTCMGGIIAFELAQMLARQGKKVGLVGLVDTYFPAPPPRHPNQLRRIYISLRTPVHHGWAVLRWKIVRALGLGRNSRLMPAWRRFVVSVLSRANRSYRPVFYPGEITLFISDATKFNHPDPRLIIESLARKNRVIRIPGDRLGLFARPAVDELAREFRVCLDEGQKTLG
jgi:pimeloyl-ACP methyl ester carboxylesterase